MRILMLGNSYTFTNDLPAVLASLTGAEVTAHTRGGAFLAEQLNPETAMGQRTLAALQDESWDFVILQEQSKAPAVSREAFLRSAEALCRLIRENGATPVFYATWAYRDGSRPLTQSGMTYEEMYDALHGAYLEAAARGHALLADVGTAFRARRDSEELYAADGSHPNVSGTRLAAQIIAEAIGKAAPQTDAG